LIIEDLGDDSNPELESEPSWLYARLSIAGEDRSSEVKVYHSKLRVRQTRVCPQNINRVACHRSGKRKPADKRMLAVMPLC
jgi:hypothetical protein